MKLFSRVALVAAATLVLSSIASAQMIPQPDATLWGGGVTNPDGSAAVPAVIYDPMSGVMWLDTAGVNNMVETTTGQMIGGDDVGFISISVTGPEADSVFLNGFVNQPIGGVVWNGQYFVGKQQLFGVGAGAEYLQPAERTDIFQYAAGLTPSDFGTVEMAVNFGAGVPGATMFGGVQFVPEPASLSMLGAAFLGLVGFLRRR